MNNKNKIKYWIRSCFIGVLFFCILFTIFIYERTEDIFNEKLAQLIATATQSDPSIEQKLLFALKNQNTVQIENGKKILQLYGYHENFANVFYDGHSFKKFILYFLFMIFLLFSCFVGFIAWLKRKNSMRIHYLAEYLCDINQGRYVTKSLNNEDEFSILEDELYKTVVRLSESKKRAKIAKKNLAKNLADISHQLKTPLTAMSLMTELL